MAAGVQRATHGCVGSLGRIRFLPFGPSRLAPAKAECIATATACELGPVCLGTHVLSFCVREAGDFALFQVQACDSSPARSTRPNGCCCAPTALPMSSSSCATGPAEASRSSYDRSSPGSAARAASCTTWTASPRPSPATPSPPATSSPCTWSRNPDPTVCGGACTASASRPRSLRSRPPLP